METLGVAVPILEGKLDHWRAMVSELKRRSDEHGASMKGKGVTLERVWLQQTPHGDMVILYMEGDDLSSYLKKVFESDDDFDMWFAQQLHDVHGIDPSLPPPHTEQIELF